MPEPGTPSTREHKLQAECMRLSEELTLLREREQLIRTNLRALSASITWRLASRLNRWVATLLGVRRGPTAWTTLEQLLAEVERAGGSPARRQVLIEQARTRHGEAATHRLGLTTARDGATLLDRPAVPHRPVKLAVVGIGCTAPELSMASETGLEVDRLERADLPGRDPDLVLAFVGEDTPPSQVEDVVAQARILDAEAVFLRHPDAGALPEWLGGWTDEELSARIARSLAAEQPLACARTLHDLARGLAAGASPLPFSPAAYLAENRDVAEAVTRGDFRSAEDHWNTIGQAEFLRGYRPYHLRAEPVSMGLRELEASLAAEAGAEIAAWATAPLISVLVPVYRVELRWLEAAVDSVRRQAYPHWQLCLVDDGSGSEEITRYLTALEDDRIRVRLLDENVGIARATQLALEFAEGDYIALLDHDDELTADALWLVARAIVEHGPDILYSDEAKLDLDGQVVEPHFKPDFSREMILSQNYISHLGVYRRSLALETGGFRPGYEGSQDHDFLLRCLARARSVFHLPRILYYWRKIPGSTAQRFGEKSHAWDAGVRAVSEAAQVLQPAARAEKARFPGTYRVRLALDPNLSVTVVIPFRDAPELLDGCIGSLLRTLPESGWEVLGVNNQSQLASTAARMAAWTAADRRIRFIDYDAPFNFSAINNFAAAHSEAGHLLFLNNDITAIEAGWLEAMLEFSQLPDVGAVGAALLYPDDTLQHAGVILGIGGVAGHSHKYMPAAGNGYFCRPHLLQNVSAVTGACLMIDRRLFLAIGGFNAEDLAVAFNDIDLCLRLLEAGYHNVYTPFARLYHHESKSRGHEDTPEKQQRFGREANYMRRRHNLALSCGDRWYNPNLTLVHENFSVREN